MYFLFPKILFSPTYSLFPPTLGDLVSAFFEAPHFPSPPRKPKPTFLSRIPLRDRGLIFFDAGKAFFNVLFP